MGSGIMRGTRAKGRILFWGEVMEAKKKADAKVVESTGSVDPAKV